MSFTTSSADNIITLGDVSDTIKLNKIMPLYTSNPSFDLNFIGGFVKGTNGTTGQLTNTFAKLFEFTTVKPGQYLVSMSYSIRVVSGGDPVVNVCISNVQTSTTSTQDFVFFNNGSNEACFTQTIPYSCTTTGTLYVNLHTAGDIYLQKIDYGYLIRIA